MVALVRANGAKNMPVTEVLNASANQVANAAGQKHPNLVPAWQIRQQSVVLWARTSFFIGVIGAITHATLTCTLAISTKLL
jgi:hypothetical protein